MTLNGILPLYKPAGMTSHDCVLMARRWLKTREVGHTGTLDPAVTGVLPLAIGRATKLVPILMDQEKAYRGTIALGSTTTTEDATGDTLVIKKAPQSKIPLPDIDDALHSLTGSILQIPPMYSAVKVKGKRLYEYARAGEKVDRPARRVFIKIFKRTDEPKWSADGHFMIPFSVSCSKGTYVRTLAVAAGERLGYPAHLFDLVRIKSAGINLKSCIKTTEMEQLAEQGSVRQAILPVERVLERFQHYEVQQSIAGKVKNGAVFSTEDYPSNGERFVFTHNGKAIAVYKPHPKKPDVVKPDVMLIPSQ